MRLIDADRLLRDPYFREDRYPCSGLIRMAVREQRTVDAVRVVRCKDCRHYDNSEGIYWCHLNSKFFPGGLDWHGFPEDGFCSYGERKDNG